jgi:nitrate reductase NapE component
MNTIPRLFEHPTWDTIASFTQSELTEFIMLALLSVGLVAAVGYGVWLALRRR